MNSLLTQELMLTYRENQIMYMLMLFKSFAAFGWSALGARDVRWWFLLEGKVWPGARVHCAICQSDPTPSRHALSFQDLWIDCLPRNLFSAIVRIKSCTYTSARSQQGSQYVRCCGIKNCTPQSTTTNPQQHATKPYSWWRCAYYDKIHAQHEVRLC